MKRSQINQAMLEAEQLFELNGWHLPPFAGWTPGDWAMAGPEADEIRMNALRWHITHNGSGDYYSTGLLLFTLRNGNRHLPEAYPKPYAEKLILDPEGQRAPAHYHRSKREDIIARAGGNIIVELTATEPDGSPSSQKSSTKSKNSRGL